MNFSSLVLSFLVLLGIACGDGDRAPIDAATRRDAVVGGSDGGGMLRDGGRPVDGAVDSGGSAGDTGVPIDSGPGGLCDPVCLAMPGSRCCMMCGCEAEVRCTPVCRSPYRWDCEVGCCFDYELLRCAN